jgi:uncharacterized protein YbjQ (UPF0145 family)
MQTSTAFEISGHRTIKTIGVVRGITVRSRSLPMTMFANFRSIFGGRISIYSELCETAREEAFQLMIKHAKSLGANALVGVRYDASPLTGTVEILCYGTAIIIESES